MCRFDLQGKISFIPTDGVSLTDRQFKLTTQEEIILLDIYFDSSQAVNGNKRNKIDFEYVLCHLYLDEDDSVTTIESDMSTMIGYVAISDVSEDLFSSKE